MRIPIEIKKITDPAGNTDLRAVIYIEDAIRDANTSQQLKKVEEEYVELIEKSKNIITKIRRTRANRANPKLHWVLGDMIVRFLHELNDNGYLLTNIQPTLSRDIGFPTRYLGYHIQLRKDYPDVESLHNEISWSKYQELLDINNMNKRAIIEKKILDGEIRTRDELRKFKKNF
jgi:hypothetical protein